MSNLNEQILEDMKAAMKAKESDRLGVLRGLRSALKNAAIEKGGADTELDEAEIVATIRKQIKQREDSISMYEEAGRTELVDKEKAEAEVLAAYLPEPIGAEELAKLVTEAIAETGAESRKDMGGVMKLLQEKTEGRADGKALSAEVMKHLG